LADNAFCLNMEFYLPGFPVIPSIQDRAIFSCFFDLGYGSNFDLDNSFKDQVLSSLGVGFRYTIGTYFSATADYGFRLHRIPGGDAMGRFYLTAVVGY
jgi:hemolysin activation/secretion protein